MGSSSCLEFKNVDPIESTQPKISITKSFTSLEEAEENKIKSNLFKLHNKLRQQYNSPPLTQNNELNEKADEYALNIIQNKNDDENIYSGKIYGENIIITNTKDENLIFSKWEEEAKSYDFTKNKLVKEASHFTQIIWKETKQIGIGFSSDEDKKKYCVVVLFDPPGNTLGEFAKNVTN